MLSHTTAPDLIISIKAYKISLIVV